MDTIAFKRARYCPAVKHSLPADYIVEYANTKLFPEGFHKPEDGYEILTEEEFKEEFAKNDKLQADWKRAKEAEARALARAKAVEEQAKARQEALANKEFEEYMAWKKTNKPKG